MLLSTKEKFGAAQQKEVGAAQQMEKLVLQSKKKIGAAAQLVQEKEEERIWRRPK